MRSRVLSKLVFFQAVGYVDLAYGTTGCVCLFEGCRSATRLSALSLVVKYEKFSRKVVPLCELGG